MTELGSATAAHASLMRWIHGRRVQLQCPREPDEGPGVAILDVVVARLALALLPLSPQVETGVIVVIDASTKAGSSAAVAAAMVANRRGGGGGGRSRDDVNYKDDDDDDDDDEGNSEPLSPPRRPAPALPSAAQGRGQDERRRRREWRRGSASSDELAAEVAEVVARVASGEMSAVEAGGLVEDAVEAGEYSYAHAAEIWRLVCARLDALRKVSSGSGGEGGSSSVSGGCSASTSGGANMGQPMAAAA